MDAGVSLIAADNHQLPKHGITSVPGGRVSDAEEAPWLEPGFGASIGWIPPLMFTV